MKQFKTIVILTLFMGFFAFSANAQNYKTAIGLRLGYPLSASIKHFINENGALEGYVGTRGYRTYRWTNISGAYQLHFDFPEVPNLQYYFGGGASVFFFNYDFVTDANGTSFGLQGYLGLDYTFEDAPISITADWIPTIFLNGYGSGFDSSYGTLGVRYILAR